MVTRVVNLAKEPHDVNIMRPGPYGNPHKIGWCQVCRRSHTRATAIEAFRAEFKNRLTGSGSMAYKKRLIEELKDKALGCVCKPQPCHGDVYVEWLEKTGQYKPKPDLVEEIDYHTMCSRATTYDGNKSSES